MTSAKETAIYSNYNWTGDRATRFNLLILVKVLFNSFGGFTMFIRKLFKSLFAKYVLLK